ncbi:phage holin family protein [Sphingomonas sp. DG1-23]|uniref:phage holin family protein n=1 Tax=Sphingomonas sp. DG1-23 TaxID=3068316 RepID=UPI00273D1216|nr:phage holin family protein [Sphingomonas sp. DG1-23]MDP5278570.1 phage holin family protein [Sphingomonas sp. DG1-23]
MAEQENEESIGTLIGRLVEDGKGYARAEIGYYRTLAASKLGEAKLGLILGAAALVLALCTVTALLVGLILSLSPLVGPGWATLIVILVALALSALLGWLAYKRILRLFGSES